eukprot:TRINITY_DN3584_c0_g1_i3.p1 TRINITY_DN3584_c0_g1~~TRINITY_DN3584_c0_g1_i3.p1  ORF type:complete len:198 (+),score=33.46 TRINITY_DN3584_c0_g1_i3:128-721(+)
MQVVLANLYNPEDAFSEITLKWKRIRAAVVASVTLGIPTDRAPSSPKVSDLLEYGSGLHTLSVPAVLVDSDFRTFLDGLSHTVYEKDECLVNEGDTDRTIFQIIKGRVRIEVKNPLDGHFVTSRILGEGAIFGEMTFVSGGPRIASVRADDELVQCLQIRAEYIEQLLSTSESKMPMNFLRAVCELIIRRFSERNLT